VSGASTYARNLKEKEAATEAVNKYAYLVKRIACHLKNRLPATVQEDDLVQSGMIGLLEAVKGFDATRGVSFEAYSGIRIRGAMLDELRRGNWTPRSVHKRHREIAEAIQQVESTKHEAATDQEIATAAGLTLAQYHYTLQAMSETKLFSFEGLFEDNREQNIPGSEKNHLDVLFDGQFKQVLSEQIEKLPEREMLCIVLYYQKEMNLKEIGAVLNVSESRVCQINSQALMRLRSRLSDWFVS